MVSSGTDSFPFICRGLKIPTAQTNASSRNNGGEWSSVCGAQTSDNEIRKKKNKIQQQCVFSKTLPGLLWFIYRPRRELLLFKLFSPENTVTIKLFTANTQTIGACILYISGFPFEQDYAIHKTG